MGKKRVIVGLIAALFIGRAAAQDFPTRPITFVVPYAAGGSTDQYARFLARYLKDELGQSIIVENKAGAGSIVGAEFVVGSKPDGYTFLYGSNSNLVTYEFVTKKPSYDPKTALLPFHGLLISPPTLIARAGAPFKTVPELIAYAKANPGKLNYATPGYNSSPHLAMELVIAEAGIELTHIPYKGEALAVADMLKGLVDMIFVFPQPFQGHIEAGTVRAVAVSGPERLSSQPDTPTFAELGLPGVIYGTWAVMALPANTSQPIVDRLASAFDKVLQDPAVIKNFADQGAAILPYKGTDLIDFLDAERRKLKEIVARAKIEPQ